ncbi:MAG: RNA methyltransferase, partial [Rhodobacteraceae bacterium]|nr:RNA methyltransferase [Paracoccaceae bacterium]
MTEVIIDRLGREGDGISADGFHPYTRPGERIVPGTPPQVLQASPDRVAPQLPKCGQGG